MRMNFSGHWLRDGSLRLTHLRGGLVFFSRKENKNKKSKMAREGVDIYHLHRFVFVFLNQGPVSSPRFEIYLPQFVPLTLRPGRVLEGIFHLSSFQLLAAPVLWCFRTR